MEAKRPVTSATRFRIYSNAKPLTATLALRLARQKRLDLDAPIGTWLHDLPPATAAITMRQLLGQMGGIRHYGSNEWMSVSRGHCKVAVEGLSPFIKDPLLAAPGAAWSYSSFGYVLASAAIEAATGEPFYALLEKEVLVPAQMADTKPDARSIADATAYDSASFGRRVVAPSVDNSCKFGAGGLVGTSDDLARFASHLMDGTLLDADSRKEMTAITVGADAKPTAYGLGVGIATDPELGTIFAHSGGSLGGRSYLLANPEHQLVVALGSNLEGESFRKQAYDIAKAFAKSPRVTNRE